MGKRELLMCYLQAYVSDIYLIVKIANECHSYEGFMANNHKWSTYGLNREQVMKILAADKSKNSLEKAAILQKNFPDEGLGENDFDVHNKTAVLSESQKIKSKLNLKAKTS